MQTPHLPTINSFKSWIGVDNLTDCISAYRKAKFEKGNLNLLKAVGKIGTLTLAAYGLYRLATKDPIFTDQLHAKAQRDLSQDLATLSPETDAFLKRQFLDQPHFKHWPASSKEFIFEALETDTLNAQATIQKAYKLAHANEDHVLSKELLKHCSKATTSPPNCLTFLELEAQTEPEEKPEDHLARITGIYRKCKKSSNAFCQANEKITLDTALAVKNWDTILGLTKDLVKKPIAKYQSFIQQATNAHAGRLNELTNLFNECNTNNYSDPKCRSEFSLFRLNEVHANSLEETVTKLSEKDMLDRLANAFEEEAPAFAKICLASREEISGCSDYVANFLDRVTQLELTDKTVRIWEKLFEGDQLKLETYFTPLLQKALEKGNWEGGVAWINLWKAKNHDHHAAVANFIEKLLDSPRWQLAEQFFQKDSLVYKDYLPKYTNSVTDLLDYENRYASHYLNSEALEKLIKLIKLQFSMEGSNKDTFAPLIRKLFEKQRDLSSYYSRYYSRDCEESPATLAKYIVTRLMPTSSTQYLETCRFYRSHDYLKYDDRINEDNWESYLT